MIDRLIFIGPLPDKRKNLGGATIKNKIFKEYLEKIGIKVRIVDTDNWRKRTIFIIFQLFYILLFTSIETIILSTSANGSYYFLKIFKFLNIRKKKIYYFMIGGSAPVLLENNIFDVKYYKNIEKIYVESLRMKEKMISIGLKRTEYLPNFKKFIIKNRSKKKIQFPLKAVFFSRITKEKGIEMVFNMLQEVNKEKTNLEIDFYGPIEVEYEKEFKNKIAMMSSAKYKGILNQEERTYDILSNYDFMVFPTLYYNEGIPGSIIDAFISSLPIISSKWGNYSQILDSSISYGFEVGNQREFEKIIFEIIRDPEQLLEKREKCFEESKKYNVNNVLEKVLEEIK